jgi:hypothetical protein
VRFTRTKNNRTVYAFILGLPSEGMTIKDLGLSSPSSPGKIAKVEVLGSKQPPIWNQAENGLTIKMPEPISGIPEYGVTLKTCLA